MHAAATDPVPSAPKRILIVDDHPVLRRGLIALIESEPDLSVKGAVATCRAALDAVAEGAVDLVTVDLVLVDGHGLDLVKQIKACHPRVPTLVLSMHDEALYGARALSAGARGYVAKEQLDETVMTAIRCVLAGHTYMSASLERRLAEKYLGGRTLETESPLQALSDRELQVFQLIGEGRSTRRIAEIFSRSVKTIESHIEHIKAKLVLESAAELSRSATQWIETGRMGRRPELSRVGEAPTVESGRTPDGPRSAVPHNRSRSTG